MKHFRIIFFLLLLPCTALLAQCGQTIEGNNGTDSLEFAVIPGEYLFSGYMEHVPDSIMYRLGNGSWEIVCVGGYCVGGPLATGQTLDLQNCAKGPSMWDNGFGPIDLSWPEILIEGYTPPISILDTGGVVLVKVTVPPGVCKFTIKMVSNLLNTIWAYRLVCPEGDPTPTEIVALEKTSCVLSSVGTYVVHTFTENGCPVDTVTTIDYSPLETVVETTTCDLGSVGSQVQTYITESGCDSVVTTEVTFIDTCNTVPTGCFYVPNAFSPNNDGINDVLVVFAGDTCVANIKSFRIFSRWGEPVFQGFNFPPNDFVYGWDGTFKGKQMDTAVFAWFAEVEFVDGSVKLFEGDVALMR